MDPWKILKWPYIIEKYVKLVEKENKIVFVVDRKARKNKIKEAFEKFLKLKLKK